VCLRECASMRVEGLQPFAKRMSGGEIRNILACGPVALDSLGACRVAPRLRLSCAHPRLASTPSAADLGLRLYRAGPARSLADGLGRLAILLAGRRSPRQLVDGLGRPGGALPPKFSSQSSYTISDPFIALINLVYTSLQLFFETCSQSVVVAIQLAALSPLHLRYRCP
jgi:hypothetical protein